MINFQISSIVILLCITCTLIVYLARVNPVARRQNDRGLPFVVCEPCLVFLSL